MIEKNKVMIKLDINTPDEIRNELNEIINNAFDYEKKVFKDIEENNLYVFSGDEKCIAKGVKKLRQNKTFEIYGRCKVRGEENTACENKAKEREAYIKFTQGYFWETTLEKYVKLTDVDTEAKATKYLRKQNPIKVIELANKNSLNVYQELNPFCKKFYHNMLVLRMWFVISFFSCALYILYDYQFWYYLLYWVNLLFLIIQSVVGINIRLVCYKKSAFILCCKAQKTKEICKFTHREDNREDKSDKSIEK